jgi:hypothetical protein
MGKNVPLWVFLLVIWFLLLITILFGWAVWHIDRGGHRVDKFKNSILFVAGIPQAARLAFQPDARIVRNKFAGAEGFSGRYSAPSEQGYILLSTYDATLQKPVTRLIRLSDTKIIHQWIPDIDQINQYTTKSNQVPKLYDKSSFRMMHPYLLPDGSLTFHSIHGPLVRIGPDGRIVWILNGNYHHSIEQDCAGNFWIPSRGDPGSSGNKLLRKIDDDMIAKVSQNGQLLFRKSVSEILIENGYFSFLFGVGPFEQDPVHLNDIQPALTSTNYWKQGDLLLSLRNRSTVLLYRPSENKIIWMKTGPWLNQHDADFLDSARIGVFSNNVLRGQRDTLVFGHNEEYVYDFSKQEVSAPFSAFLARMGVGTITEGRSDIIGKGGLFVEESNNGRLLMGDSSGMKWQFVNGAGKGNVAILNWSRYISHDEFQRKFSKTEF